MTSEKTILTLILGVLSFIAGEITTLTIIFIFMILIDYLTGTLGSIREGKKFTWEIIRNGLIKKAGYIFFWILAVFMDLIIIQEGPNIGLTLTTPIMALVATCWLIGTEGTSIVANLYRMGVVELPGWLGKFFDGLTNIDPNSTEGDEND